MPSAKQVDALGVFLVKLIGLDREHSFDNTLSNGTEGVKANSGADNCDSLNSLATELLVLSLMELFKVSQEELD